MLHSRYGRSLLKDDNMEAAFMTVSNNVALALPENLASGLRRSQLPALDGLRAVGAFLVVFYHFGIPMVPGGLGVLIFFVLSGFLITCSIAAEAFYWSA